MPELHGVGLLIDYGYCETTFGCHSIRSLLFLRALVAAKHCSSLQLSRWL